MGSEQNQQRHALHAAGILVVCEVDAASATAIARQLRDLNWGESRPGFYLVRTCDLEQLPAQLLTDVEVHTVGPVDHSDAINLVSDQHPSLFAYPMVDRRKRKSDRRKSAYATALLQHAPDEFTAEYPGDGTSSGGVLTRRERQI